MGEDTKKYKVLKDVTIGEVAHVAESEVELTAEVAAPFVESGDLEEVKDAA